MSNNPVGWFEIYVDDTERAKKFYESVLDIKLELLSDPSNSNVIMWSFPFDMEKYGSSGALVKMDGFTAGGNSTIVYFHSEDCSIEEARIESAGGKVQQPKTSIGEHGFIVLASDTEGNIFGVHSQK